MSRLKLNLKVPKPFLGIFKEKMDLLKVSPLKCMLLKNTYELNLNEHANISQIVGHEVNHSGYTRIPLVNVTLQDIVGGYKLTCDELVFEDVNWETWYACIFNNNDGEIIAIGDVITDPEGNPAPAAPSGQKLMIIPEGNGFLIVTSNNLCQSFEIK